MIVSLRRKVLLVKPLILAFMWMTIRPKCAVPHHKNCSAAARGTWHSSVHLAPIFPTSESQGSALRIDGRHLKGYHPWRPHNQLDLIFSCRDRYVRRILESFARWSVYEPDLLCHVRSNWDVVNFPQLYWLLVSGSFFSTAGTTSK